MIIIQSDAGKYKKMAFCWALKVTKLVRLPFCHWLTKHSLSEIYDKRIDSLNSLNLTGLGPRLSSEWIPENRHKN